MKIPLLIIGASTRWLAQGAARRGLNFIAADYYADWDTGQSGLAKDIDRLADVAELAERYGADEILLGGGMENQWEPLALAARQCRILGFAPRDLQRVRDPATWASALRDEGIDVPDTRVNAPTPELKNGRWLMKPIRSGGGRAIEFWRPDLPVSSDHYWQQWVPGIDASATFLAAAGTSQLVGVSRQLIGTKELGAKGFQYAGCVGPQPVTDAVAVQLIRIGDVLARTFNARGLFGVDFRLDGDVVRPVEINPRPTASVELYERAGASDMFELHWGACNLDENQPYAANRVLEHLSEARFRTGDIFGKGVVYWQAPQAIAITPRRFQLLHDRYAAGIVADIPRRGSLVVPQAPLCTVWATGSKAQDVIARLGVISEQLRGDLLQADGEPIRLS